MAENVHEGPGKGQAFFNHARTAAESGNFDYAIELYVQGLNRDPNNIEEHDALRKIGLQRKVKGGKPAGGLFGPKLPFKGKSPKEQMLNAEFLYAKDPGNLTHMMALLRGAAAGEYSEVTRWFGPYVAMANKTKPKRDIYLELADTYEKIGDYRKAAEAAQSALEMTPNDMDLIARIKDLGARETIMQGQYETAKDFKDSIKDKEMTKKLLEEENLAKSDEYRLKAVEQAKADYEKNPLEHQVISKYIKALADTEDEKYENEAIVVAQKAYEDTKTYRYKATIGDIKMRQYKRTARFLQEAVKADPKDAASKQQLADHQKEWLAFELEEYHERVTNYPSDMAFLFEYGKRLYLAKRYEEAITVLQRAQNNPKVRVDALHLLGMCFIVQNMKPEAIDTLNRAIGDYELAETGDQKSKELHYWLARSYEDTGKINEATGLYSKITQWDINYRDTRERLASLRAKQQGATA